MLVDGRAIAAQILDQTAIEVAQLGDAAKPRLAIITCAPNFETQKYLQLKQRRAVTAGISITITELPVSVTTAQMIETVEQCVLIADAVVVQLPLPAQVDREAVLKAVPVTHDPDGFSYETAADACLPPVVAAVAAIAKVHGVDFKGKNVVLVGQGRLVGSPIKHYLDRLGVTPTIVTESSTNTESVLKTADIIITGVGKPGLITSSMVKEGVLIFDAGTSEEGGMLVGDVQPEVAQRAALFTPVPGGIGPVTVAALLANVMILAKQQ